MIGPAPPPSSPQGARRSFLQRWRRIGWPDRALLCETMAVLAFARIAIMALPFRTVGWIAGRWRKAATPNAARCAVIVGRVRWAIAACARRAPFRAVCFQQGLAAQIMLRRRGVRSFLYFGAAPDDARGLAAHVWVHAGGEDVVGGKDAPRFAVLARFPTDDVEAQSNEQ